MSLLAADGRYVDVGQVTRHCGRHPVIVDLCTQQNHAHIISAGYKHTQRDC